MIKIQDEERVDCLQAIDEALIEEAIAKWEAIEPLIDLENDDAEHEETEEE